MCGCPRCGMEASPGEGVCIRGFGVEEKGVCARAYASSSEMDESEDMDDVRDDARRWREAAGRVLGGDAGAQRAAAGEVE